jgi:hypothetical protein
MVMRVCGSDAGGWNVERFVQVGVGITVVVLILMLMLMCDTLWSARSNK